MDKKKKIILKSSRFFGEENQDMFIELNLNRNFSEIPKERYLNEFDYQKQFRDERNASRNFVLYGILDSNIIDTDNITLRVYSDDSFSSLVKTTTSTPLGYNQKNVFNKKRGKYYIELNNYEFDKVFIIILSNGQNFTSQVYEQTLVFRDSDGDFIEYGQETVGVGLNGASDEINNDFYFLYNRHWIEKDLNIVEAQKRYVYFTQNVYTTNEGDSVSVIVRLNEPSIFGLETVDVKLNTPPGFASNTAVGDNNSGATDYSITNFPTSNFPISLSWSAGETEKQIIFEGLTDEIIEELSEEIEIELSNESNVVVDNNLYDTKALVRFRDTTEKFLTRYNFQSVIKNIAPFTKDWSISSVLPVFSDLQIGYPNFYSNEYPDNKNYRFYPNDSFELTITNEGNNTTLPIIPGYTIAEEYFPAGASKTILIQNTYQNQNSLSIESLTLEFREKTILNAQTNERGQFIINGWRVPIDASFGGTGSGYPLDADSFWNIVENSSFYDSYGLERPFISERINDTTIKLTANHPTVNINVTIPEPVPSSVNPQPRGGVSGQTYSGGDVSLSGRVDNELIQIPLTIDLYGNLNGNQQSRYSFSISKPGYKNVNIPADNLNALSSPNEYYLVSALGGQIKGPDLSLSSSTAICSSKDVVSGDYYLQTNGFYINGLALLTDTTIGYQNISMENATQYGHNINTGFTHQFLSSPISNPINCDNVIDISDTPS
jgi:hypothetical protein